MKTYFYDVERGYFVNSVGGAVGIVPTLVYGEQAVWRFFFKTAAGTVYDLSGITELNAAVGVAVGGTVAATTEGIALDVTAGSVTVPINCLTEQFYNATVGKPNGVYGFFELTGYDAAQGKALYIRFNTLLNEVVNPDIHTIPGLLDMILGVVSSGGFVTSDTVNAIASSAAENTVSSGGFVTSSGAEIIASNTAHSAASSAVSGAIFSNTEIDTQIGAYHIRATSGGGLSVSGSGASVVLSGGAITARAAEGGSMSLDADGGVSIYTAGHNININADGGGDVNINGTNIPVNGDLTVNARPVATQLVTSTVAGSGPFISVLSGGTSYVFANLLEELVVDSVAKSTEASYLHFTLDSVTAPTPVVISGVSYLNSATFEGGKEYIVGFFDGMCVANEVTSGGAQQ